jgi:tetratricopeptide (TPR) repeat protein
MPELPIQKVFDQAARHHQTGKLREAEQLYRQILAQQPEHVEAIHYLGVIAHQVGRNDAAVELIRRAIALRPDYAEAHYNLGNALRELKHFDEAVAASRKAIALKPNYIEAYNNLGNALRENGQLDEAVGAYRQALALRPSYAAAQYNLGVALKDQGHLEDALAAFRQAIALNPNFPESHCNVGVVLKEKGELDEATAAFRQAIALNANLPEAHNNLGNVLREKGQLDEAIAASRRAIALRPNYADALSNLGNALREKGQLDEAMAAYAKAIALKPGWALPRLNLGQLFRELGRFEEARAVFQQAAECEPNNPDTHNYLATALAEMYRFDEANQALDRAAAIAPDSASTHAARGMILSCSGRELEAVESFRRAIEIAPESAAVLSSLGQTLRQIGRFTEAAECFRRMLALPQGAGQAYTIMAGIGASFDATEMARLTASLDDPRTSIRDRAALGFGLGKMLDDADRFDEAFAHYARANALTLQLRHAGGERYSSELFARQVDESIAQYRPDFFARTRDWGEPSDLPVFIVGMPRSGTSLVEQIAASHPDVFGGGELRQLGEIAGSLSFAQLNPRSVRDAAAKHLDYLRSLGRSASRVIDKTPSHVERLGLIATLFPAARVILCRRDSRDTCLSCFFQKFSYGNLFSFDLANCGRHHVQTDRIIAHWLKVLPLQLLQVQYEDLVADLEGQSRRIVSFLDLAWNPACLDFHRTERTVLTSSAWQVRQPIYSRSVGRWRNYEKHLSPLFEALGQSTATARE